MNLHHLRYFLAVARTGGFTPAARELHVTQPTVSNGVAELERSLGVRLFNRTGKQVALTLEGRSLLTYGQQINDLVMAAEEHIQGGQVVPGERFQFGAIDAAVIYLLPEILKQYMLAYPDVQLSAQVAPSRYLVEDLLMNRSEFALISLPYDDARLDTLTLVEDDMPLVVGSDHALAGQIEVSPARVVEEPLILFHADSVSRHLVDERFAEAGVVPRVVMEMRSPEAMRKLVEAGVGISFLPRMTVADSLAAGSLHEVEVAGMRFRRQIGMAWRRGRYFGPTIRRLLESVLERYGKLEEWSTRMPLDPGEARAGRPPLTA